MTLHISDAFRELLYPFRKWLPTVNYAIIKKKSVGFEQWEIECNLYSKDDKKVTIPENDEIKAIAQLWGEDYLSDFIHNWAAQHIFQNMRGYEEKVYAVFDKS